MCAQVLRSYFETDLQQRRALDAFFDAWDGKWSVSKELLDPLRHLAFGGRAVIRSRRAAPQDAERTALHHPVWTCGQPVGQY